MNWTVIFTSLITASVPTIIGSIITYITLSKKAESESRKAILDQETALKTIESNQKIAIDTIEKNAQYEIEKMRIQTLEEIQLYNAKSQTDLKGAEGKIILEETQKMFSSLMSNSDSGEFMKQIENMNNISSMLNVKK